MNNISVRYMIMNSVPVVIKSTSFIKYIKKMNRMVKQ